MTRRPYRLTYIVWVETLNHAQSKTVKAVKAPCDCQLDSLDSFEPLTLFSNACLLREPVPPLSYLFIVLLADRNNGHRTHCC